MRRYNFELRKRIAQMRKEDPNMSLADIGTSVGVSKQRVHQILMSPMRVEPSKKVLELIAKAVKRAKKKVEKDAA